MADLRNVIIGDHPIKGRMFAVVDPSARYVTPSVASTRMGAWLAPFSNTAAALTALSEAGCKVGENPDG